MSETAEVELDGKRYAVPQEIAHGIEMLLRENIALREAIMWNASWGLFHRPPGRDR